ncbi:putative disease resistance protein RGA3 isoform X1 [Phoenix dactylifera]|uniref:Disease resistance protein RGA3 isoform X1 n=1 Tax=Phoenix dactylifera TaxID=42345 RepID=A0A8B8ZCJ0_PHODC|nr:putative disease resistance protein RGA3 isoform X1 [Phoenix dactylifera]
MAMILDAFVGRSIGKLLEFIEGEISMVLGVKDELRKLQRTMERIRGFLESAERKRHADRNINTWVTELKDIMYDADDIIDLCMIEGRRLLEDHTSKSAVRHPSCLFSCFSCIKSRHEIGSKIRKLNDRLKEMNEDRSILSKLDHTEKDVQVRGVNHRQTFPSGVKSDIVGTQIEEATQSLVESLIKEDNKKYRILGIVGMGGIGKTTLASNIYNDEGIKENFPIRLWACVSQEFSEIKLLKAIIESAGEKCGEFETKAALVPYLSSILSKIFFIVLDDVWHTDVWEHLLRYPIESATASGKILITTRNRNVARNMRAEIHRVDKMDNDSGWELLHKNVFGDDDDEEEDISRLKEIGVQIVEKCDGLPLAIKVIAGVLRSKDRSTIEWNKVLKSDAWSMSQLHEELPGALFLSYENLPSDLKQCFLYCSLFLEDYIMDRDDLIHYWVVEGFIQPAQEDTLMEDLAEDYYMELIGRNLLQPYNVDNWGDRHGNLCKMHDLLRSLALFLICDESIFLGSEQSPNINPLTKIRRLSMWNAEQVPDAIKQQKCLRTLMLLRSPKEKMIENELFERLRFLRSITINDARIERLTDSIGDLLHLRYLDLDRTNISNLPESIGCLVNLQILNLSGCSSLYALPKAITKLCNLRCLRLGGGTPLSHVPKGLGKLKHLNHLEGFVVSHDDRRGTQDDEGCDLEELQSLPQLRFLEVRSLERAQPVGAPVLADTRSLRTLILTSSPPSEDVEDAIATQRIDEIYNELSPRSTHLQRLDINDFLGTRFPTWMMSPSLNVSFPNLTSIKLIDCKSCPQLPPLGLLLQLKFLFIAGAHTIKTIGPEFLGPRASAAAGTAFPKLEELEFCSMNNWEEWSFGMVEGVGEERRGASKLLPRLKRLFLWFCPKLRALPEGLRHATSLQELVIFDADNLIEIDNLPALKSLHIERCPRLEHVKNLDKLQYLKVMETFAADADGETEHLPQWLLELLQNAPAALQNLKRFTLTCSLPLLKTFLKDGPNWPIIQWIPHVMISSGKLDKFGRSQSYIEYTKDPPAFKTNVVESEESAD